MITAQQIRLVRESFPAVAEAAGPIAMLFYGRLFELAPEVRPMFKQDIGVQGRKLMDMLTAVVGHLDDMQRLAPGLAALGQRHVGYGVRPEHYQTLTTALTWAIGVALDRDFSTDVRAAWIAVLNEVAAVMKGGAAAVGQAADRTYPPPR